MKISFFGSSLLSAYWNGAATYYRGIIRALHRLGYEITFYEPDAFGRQQHRDIAPPAWARVEVYSAEGCDAVLRAVETAARTSDLIIKASGVGVFDELLERAVAQDRVEHELAGVDACRNTHVAAIAPWHFPDVLVDTDQVTLIHLSYIQHDGRRP